MLTNGKNCLVYANYVYKLLGNITLNDTDHNELNCIYLLKKTEYFLTQYNYKIISIYSIITLKKIAHFELDVDTPLLNFNEDIYIINKQKIIEKFNLNKYY